MVYQRTLDSDIYCTGVGLHSGKEISLTLKPAPPDTGIVFVRTDLHGDFSIKAKMEAVIASSFATTLGKNGVSIATIEHLLAAFSGLGIDNAIVEVDAAEIPIMDGSVFLKRLHVFIHFLGQLLFGQPPFQKESIDGP